MLYTARHPGLQPSGAVVTPQRSTCTALQPCPKAFPTLQCHSFPTLAFPVRPGDLGSRGPVPRWRNGICHTAALQPAQSATGVRTECVDHGCEVFLSVDMPRRAGSVRPHRTTCEVNDRGGRTSEHRRSEPVSFQLYQAREPDSCLHPMTKASGRWPGLHQT